MTRGYRQFFGTKEQPYKPARTTLRVVLPAATRGALVEVDLIAVRPKEPRAHTDCRPNMHQLLAISLSSARIQDVKETGRLTSTRAAGSLLLINTVFVT